MIKPKLLTELGMVISKLFDRDQGIRVLIVEIANVFENQLIIMDAYFSYSHSIYWEQKWLSPIFHNHNQYTPACGES